MRLVCILQFVDIVLISIDKFLEALNHTSDAEATRTLKLLYANHTRKAKELERKLNRRDLAEQTRPETHRISNLPPVAPSTASLAQSDRYIEDSYMVLHEDDESDPFNKFLVEIEQIANRLSNPVAFATLPLTTEQQPKKQPGSGPGPGTGPPASIQDSFYIVPKSKSMPSDAMGPFNVRRTTPTRDTGPMGNKTIEEFALENDQLKSIVDELSRKLSLYSKQAEEANMLRSSILQFKADVQRNSKRIMQSQDLTRSTMSTRTSPDSSLSTAVTGVSRRMRELEDENRTLKAEMEKQQAINDKYKERWEKLKASARKRRNEPKDGEVAAAPTTPTKAVVKIPAASAPPPFSRTPNSPRTDRTYQPATSSPLAVRRKDP